MSVIEQQVKELRELSEILNDDLLGRDRRGSAQTVLLKISQAADTIEALSAKLAVANIERSDRYYSGGWIACEDRLPEEGKEVLVYLKQGRMTVAARIGKEWVRPDETRTAIVVSWRELPEPYRP